MTYSNGIGDWKALNPVTPASTAETREIRQTNGTAKPGDASTPSPVQTDEARLSAASGLIAEALQVSDVRSSKVAALQQAIANGSYNVSSSDVADKLIQVLQD